MYTKSVKSVEDLSVGQIVTISSAKDKNINFNQYIGEPFKILAINVPFLMCFGAISKRKVVDTRLTNLVYLDKEFADEYCGGQDFDEVIRKSLELEKQEIDLRETTRKTEIELKKLNIDYHKSEMKIKKARIKENETYLKNSERLLEQIKAIGRTKESGQK